jgi:hypothetical protein
MNRIFAAVKSPCLHFPRYNYLVVGGEYSQFSILVSFLMGLPGWILVEREPVGLCIVDGRHFGL